MKALLLFLVLDKNFIEPTVHLVVCNCTEMRERMDHVEYICNLHGISLARRGGLDPAHFSTPLTEPPLRFRTGN